MKDFTLKDFLDAIADLDKLQREEQIRRNKQSELDDKAEKKRRKDILNLRHVHAKCDALLGLYPITKEKLLEQSELINSSSFVVDDYGNRLISTKAWACLGIELIGDDAERLYDYYLTDVKPFIF